MRAWPIVLLLTACPKGASEPAPLPPPVPAQVQQAEPAPQPAPEPASVDLDPQPGPDVTLVLDWSVGGQAQVSFTAKSLQVQGDVIRNRTVTEVSRVDHLGQEGDEVWFDWGTGQGSTSIRPGFPGVEAMQALMTTLSTGQLRGVAGLDGDWLRIEGFDAYAQAVQQQADALAGSVQGPIAQAVSQTTTQALDPDTVDEDLAAQWGALVGDYVGLALSMEAPVSHTTARGAAIEVSLLGWVPCDGEGPQASCVAIQVSAPASDEEVAKMEEAVMAGMSEGLAPDAAPPRITQTHIENTTILVTEPATMRPWSQTKVSRIGHTLWIAEGAPLMALGRERAFTTTWAWDLEGEEQ